MNNLSSYFGLVDAKIGASDKDLPVVEVPVEVQSKHRRQTHSPDCLYFENILKDLVNFSPVLNEFRRF